MEFNVLVKQVTSKALVSLDKEYEVKLRTGDHRIMELSKLPADVEIPISVPDKYLGKR